MLLEGKNAVIYGGGGRIGSAVANVFSREGARVFLGGRTLSRVETVATEIRAGGGAAEASQVDALDDVQGTPLVEMPYEDFSRPVEIAMRSTFVTVKAAARHMTRQGSGVILAFGGSGDPVPDYSIGGFQIALHVVEAMRRQLSSELGRQGIRFVTLRTGGILETIPRDRESGEEIARGLVEATMLKRAATLEDVGNVAAFVASDRARTMTAATVNVSAGALIDD